MRRYETICIVRPSAGDEKFTAIIDKTNEIISQNNGTTLTVDQWGVKKLAYLIQKEQQGYYIYMEYAGTPDAVNEIERVYRIDDQIIKYMTVKTQDTYIPDPEPEPEEDLSQEEATAEENVEKASEDTEASA